MKAVVQHRYGAADQVLSVQEIEVPRPGDNNAEHAAMPQDFLVRKPANVTFEPAAVVPASGFIGLSNLGMSRSFAGRRVLVNGGLSHGEYKRTLAADGLCSVTTQPLATSS
jgi:NADPH:quinone reductase-like Zn-dependent oxidoreductase